MKNKFVLLFFLLFSGCIISVAGQSVWKNKKIPITKKELHFDSLSVVFSSVKIIDTANHILNSADYKIDFAKATLTWIKPPAADSVTISYKTFALDFTKAYFHKDIKAALPVTGFVMDPFIYNPSESVKQLLDFDKGMNYNGNYTRGISLGNSQNLVTNSNFNLQLNGNLGNDVQVTAAMTDNNLPLQPEGNTAQIQDFDKIFIQLKHKQLSLIAGDVVLDNSGAYFLQFNKKLQGAIVNSVDSLKHNWQNQLTAGVAISRGKYSRNLFTGVEGNQGPYRMTGQNGETFIIILAGTEKVFIDGIPMKRGAEYDYVADYNLGEIIFTTNRLITKDSRITIEFQYAERNYLRTTLYLSDAIVKNKTKWTVKLYNENDAKNQPQEPFKKNERTIMSGVGDSIDRAFINTATTATFDVNKIMYQKETVINGSQIDTIFVFSTHPDSAKYTVNFALVGAGKGDYIQSQNLANGRVYQYAGKGAGQYLPIALLITPKQQTMLTFGNETGGKTWKLNSEFAISQNDVNTFSTKDNADNTGIAGRMNLTNTIPFHQRMINGNTSYEYVQNRFVPIENFRAIEFNRDWNLQNGTAKPDQHFLQSVWNFQMKNNRLIQYGVSGLLMGNQYKALQHQAKILLNYKSVFMDANGTWLSSQSTLQKSEFIKPNLNVYKNINWLKGMRLGVKGMSEWNKKTDLPADTLSRNSFWNDRLQTYISSNDSLKNKYSLSAERRWDYRVFNNQKKYFSQADVFQTTADVGSLKHQHINFSATYRKLYSTDSTSVSKKNEGTILGNILYEADALDNLFHYQTNYETGTTQELKREYAFLKVPDGQGHYSWVDYNNDGVQQLNEFTENDFSSNLSYDKVLIPTTVYVRANQVEWNQSMSIEPVNYWGEKYGQKIWFNRFALQANMQYTRKVLQDGTLQSFKPFSHIADSLIVNENNQYQTQLFFNRNQSAFGTDVSYTYIKLKAILSYGFETRSREEWQWHTRLNMNSQLSNVNVFSFSKKSSTADYLLSQQYHILTYTAEPKLNYLYRKNIRFTIGYNYKLSSNRIADGGDSAKINKLITEIKYAVASKGQVVVGFTMADVKYNRSTNSQVAYTILEGLKTGKNYLWNVSWERKLAKGLEMNITYEGRKTGDTGKIIHTGRASIRAVF